MKPVQRLGRAASAFARGDLVTAESECLALIAAAPHSADARHLLGLIRRRQGRLTAAADLLRSSTELEPGRLEFRINLGNLLCTTGRFADAEAQYRAALDIEPDSRTARLALARTLNASRAHAVAESEARRVLQADADDAEAWVALGVAQRAQGSLAEAESSYRRAVALRPDYAVAHHNLGALLGQLKRAEESLVELDRAEALGLAGRELHFNRGRALMELGQFDAASAALEAALCVAPDDVDSQVLLAKLRFMRGDTDFARSVAAACATSPMLRLVHADLLRRAGRLEESAAILRAATSTAAWAPSAAAGLALVLQEQGKLAEALSHARRASVARPEDSDVAETLVTLLLQCGHVDEARAMLAALRARHPLDQRWLAHEAVALRVAGDPGYSGLYDYARFVRSYDLAPPAGYASIEDLNAQLATRLSQLHGQGFRTHPLDQSLRLGTQTPRSLLADPDPHVRAFLGALEAPLADYQRSIGRDPAHAWLSRNTGPARIVGCWSVRLTRGGHHVNHVHPEGWVSSAYYVAVPAEVRDQARRNGWLKFGEPHTPTPGAGPAHFVEPRAGRLVLFPSCMWHGTTPIAGDEPRLTVAFDAVPASA